MLAFLCSRIRQDDLVPRENGDSVPPLLIVEEDNSHINIFSIIPRDYTPLQAKGRIHLEIIAEVSRKLSHPLETDLDKAYSDVSTWRLQCKMA